MKSCGFLFLALIAILIIIDEFSCKCVAGKLCPDRAVPIVAPEGVKCVCGHGYFGKNCRFKGQNVLILTASWLKHDYAKVTWKAGSRLELFHVFTRRVRFDNSTGLPSYRKWMAGVQSINTKEENNWVTEYREKETRNKVVFSPPLSTNSTVYLHLNSVFSYEIRIVKSADQITSSTIFLDAQPPQAFALHEEKTNRTNKSEENKCSLWYKCPDQWFTFTTFLKDFNEPCFKNGIVIGVFIGIIGTVILSALTYATVRLCIHCIRVKKTKKIRRLCINSKNEHDELTGLKELYEARAKDTVKFGFSKSSAGSVIIDVSLPDSLKRKGNDDIKSKNIAESKSAKSLIIQMSDADRLKAVNDS